MGTITEVVIGSIWDSNADAIIVPVNCVGVMGAGMALQCKLDYPIVFDAYKRECEKGIDPGTLLAMFIGHQRHLILMPTKTHYRLPSTLEIVESSLKSLKCVVFENRFRSVAVPALGCGLGGLKWSDVRPLIVRYLDEIPDCTFYMYGPEAHR